jgi:hypothetical protein
MPIHFAVTQTYRVLVPNLAGLPAYNLRLHDSELRLTEPGAYQLSATVYALYADQLKLHHDCLHASHERLPSVIHNKLVARLKDVLFPPAGFTRRICLLAKTVAKKYAPVAPEHHKATRLGQSIHFDHWDGPPDFPGLPLEYTGALVGEEEFLNLAYSSQHRQSSKTHTVVLKLYLSTMERSF